MVTGPALAAQFDQLIAFIPSHRFGSRRPAGANTAHPETKRSYRLRTYLFCRKCGRRMFGKARC